MTHLDSGWTLNLTMMTIKDADDVLVMLSTHVRPARTSGPTSIHPRISYDTACAQTSVAQQSDECCDHNSSAHGLRLDLLLGHPHAVEAERNTRRQAQHGNRLRVHRLGVVDVQLGRVLVLMADIRHEPAVVLLALLGVLMARHKRRLSAITAWWELDLSNEAILAGLCVQVDLGNTRECHRLTGHTRQLGHPGVLGLVAVQVGVDDWEVATNGRDLAHA
mmetsp:Transcript_39013/g.83955  ORF Transcript_39013/g.83955 Transcript_39013/m.83955 type:complete len:220 (+) Transcript_39013:272-931(+)